MLNQVKKLFRKQKSGAQYRNIFQVLHLDLPLFAGIILIMICGLFILYSASNGSTAVLLSQGAHIAFALIILFLFAQIPPWAYERWAPHFFVLSLAILLAVSIIGKIALGAERWITLGPLRFQPSDLMRLAIPLALAWYFAHRVLPAKIKDIAMASLIIFIPSILTAKEPDLGSAIVLFLAGTAVLLFAGIAWRWVLAVIFGVIALIPLLWHFMHTYQKERVLTFLDPSRSPLGSGYHIIQSEIAIGSGGVLGKGFLNGTQSHLNFLPEHATDFIFAVCGEEFGLFGATILLTLYLLVTARCLYIAYQGQDTFTRLLAGSLSFLFFLSVFINIGMVVGILPVVGLPLPLISYGGTSMVTLLAGFGILMSIHGHRKLLS